LIDLKRKNGKEISLQRRVGESFFCADKQQQKYCLKNGAEKQDILLYRTVFL
jgi:hypothetical protein